MADDTENSDAKDKGTSGKTGASAKSSGLRPVAQFAVKKERANPRARVVVDAGGGCSRDPNYVPGSGPTTGRT
jgi:hypothetical protein